MLKFVVYYNCSGIVRKSAINYKKTPEQIFFAFVRSQGVTFLTGTTSATHMLQDLEASENIVLTEMEIMEIQNLLVLR